MGVVLTILGIIVIVVGLQDMFHTLLHPSGRGGLSRRVLSAVWRVSKVTGHRAGSAVGPAAMVAVVLLWVVLQTAGWALIYYPHVPGGFTYSTGIDPDAYPDAVEAVYVSVVTLSTLGYGDMVATDSWIRVTSPFEALTGFALLTAAMTWFTQNYPPLMRRRALALELKGLADADYAETVEEIEPTIASRILDSLQADLTKISVDFTQHTEGFYFQESNPDLSLAHQLPYALRMRDAAMTRPEPAMRLSAQRLSSALDQLGSEIKDDFVGTGEHPGEVFAAYAAEHGQSTRA